MDNQPQTITPGSAITPAPTPQPVAPQPAPQMPVTPSQPAKKNKSNAVLIILIILLLVTTGVLGYFYYQTNTTLQDKSRELSEAYQTIEQFQDIIDDYEAVNEFIAEENTPALSRGHCSSAPLKMFDVYLNDQFGVFRYACVGGKEPVRIAALKKLDDGSYEFTYGASTLDPDGLPDYIYDSDPEFFSTQYGAHKF